MFCPQCGQQQASNGPRFCSRCGFPLDAVTGLLATGGVAAAASANAGESPRRRGMRHGGKLLLIGLFLIPATAILHDLLGLTEELPLIGVIIFLGGLLRLLYSLFFDEGKPRRASSTPRASEVEAGGRLGARQSQGALPGVGETPVQSHRRPRAATSDLEYRPSVTEGTTRLLDEQDSSGR